jgi:predicted transcriptional regulator of viral defense system
MIFNISVPRRAENGRIPRWDALYEIAAPQQGYFSLEQAEAAGYSPQLLQYHLRSGKLERSMVRGVFRLVHFPPSDREDLVPVWLWSKREGVFGLQTALSIYELSDALPAHYDLLVPAMWTKRRVQVPAPVQLRIADVPPSDWQWIGPVPVTTPTRTLRDCVRYHVAPDLVDQAFADAVRRGVVSRTEARAIRREAA